MKERPIIVTTELIPKILDGSKTQTRRVIKRDLPTLDELRQYWGCLADKTDDELRRIRNDTWISKCPYGQVGDRLWVRETHYRYGKWVKNGLTKTGRQRWRFKPSNYVYRYREEPPDDVKPNSYRKDGWYKRPSIFMPRWASRITLEITNIRVEMENNKWVWVIEFKKC